MYWYQASSATPSVATSQKTIDTTSSATAGNLTFTFSLQSNDAPKLTAASTGKTFIYDSGVTAQTVGEATPIEVTVPLADKFGTMALSLTSIQINGEGEDVKGTENTMKSFAGTYNFELYVVSGNGVMTLTAPTSDAEVGAMSNSDIAIKVVVGANGSVSLQDSEGNALSSFYFGVRGQASLETGVQATFGVRIPN